MKKLAILVSISLVVGIPLLYGYEKQNNMIKLSNMVKTEEVSTTETTESNQSNWEEEFDKSIVELNQSILESDIEWGIIQLCVGMNDEVSKGMIVDCLVDVHGYDRELVSEIIDGMDIDWKYNCKVTFRSLLNEGSDPDRIPLMLKELQFTEEEIQYAIDNH